MSKPVLKRKPINIRMLVYSIFTFGMTAWLTLAVNCILIALLAFRFRQYEPEYIDGGEIMEELTLTDQGYALSGGMQGKLEEKKQWAMLLNEEGEVVWSYDRPEEIADSYTLADIARMSKWYLKDYPVSMRVWDDRIMVVGTPQGSMWKYNIQFSLSWLDYCKRIWFWVLLFDFLWILTLAVIFTRRWAKSREKARIEWIAGISHDIRTPLSVVLGYAAVLEDSSRLSGEERRQAAAIRHQSLVMKELVEDLNLTSELEYSMQALRKEPVHPATVLREVAAGFLDDAAAGTLEIEMDIDDQAEVAVLIADRKLLVRALRNLFQNSMRHSRQEESTLIRLSLQKERQWCTIIFSDHGIGYSEEMLRRLNGRRGRQPTPNIRGLGIVCKIVQAHGGKISFGNKEEGGSFCKIRLKGGN